LVDKPMKDVPMFSNLAGFQSIREFNSSTTCNVVIDFEVNKNRILSNYTTYSVSIILLDELLLNLFTFVHPVSNSTTNALENKVLLNSICPKLLVMN